MVRGLPFLLCLVAVACAPRELRVTMNDDNNSGQEGFAVLTDRGAGMTVYVQTTAPLFVKEQVAHIHPGNCGELDAPRVELTKLTAADGGTARSTTEVAGFGFKDLATGDWAINVHDARDSSIYVSCGQLPRP